MKQTFLLIAVMALTPFAVTQAENGVLPAVHEYKDGFVERAMSMVVRGNRIHCEYFIGLNTKTAELIVAQMEADAKRDREALANGLTNHKTKGVPVMASPQSKPGVGQHLTDPQTVEKFSQHAESWFAKHLKIQNSGQTVFVKNLKITQTARHPFSISVTFEIPLTNSKKGNKTTTAKQQINVLRIRDHLFKMNSGAVRYALKAKGDAMLLQSNVDPILVRADRVELDGLSKPKRLVATTVIAKISIPRATSKLGDKKPVKQGQNRSD